MLHIDVAELSSWELRQYVKEHESPHVQQYVETLHDEAQRIEERYREIRYIESSPAGRGAACPYAMVRWPLYDTSQDRLLPGEMLPRLQHNMEAPAEAAKHSAYFFDLCDSVLAAAAFDAALAFGLRSTAEALLATTAEVTSICDLR